MDLHLIVEQRDWAALPSVVIFVTSICGLLTAFVVDKIIPWHDREAASAWGIYIARSSLGLFCVSLSLLFYSVGAVPLGRGGRGISLLEQPIWGMLLVLVLFALGCALFYSGVRDIRKR
jgi:divalent metal cation (Fe/Co/Zn/Cd) transporter